MDDLRAIRDTYLGERRALVDALTRASREGIAAAEVARLVAPALGRDRVLEYLAAVTLGDDARTALAEARLDDVLDVSVTGIDTPREARLRLSADPCEITDLERLPRRCRAVLRDFHIALAPTHDDDPHAGPDDLLRDGRPVRLVRLEPHI